MSTTSQILCLVPSIHENVESVCLTLSQATFLQFLPSSCFRLGSAPRTWTLESTRGSSTRSTGPHRAERGWPGPARPGTALIASAFGHEYRKKKKKKDMFRKPKLKKSEQGFYKTMQRPPPTSKQVRNPVRLVPVPGAGVHRHRRFRVA